MVARVIWLAIGLLAATTALAASDEPPPMTANALEHLISRPHTIAEIEAGIIALPNAPISPGQKGGDTPLGRVGRGDATLQAGVHVLYRFQKDYIVGAGIVFSPFGTSDDQYGGLSRLARTHTLRRAPSPCSQQRRVSRFPCIQAPRGIIRKRA